MRADDGKRLIKVTMGTPCGLRKETRAQEGRGVPAGVVEWSAAWGTPAYHSVGAAVKLRSVFRR